MLRLLWLLVVTLFSSIRARARRGPLRPSWSLVFEWIVRYLRRDAEDTAQWAFPRLRADLHRRVYPADASRRVDVRDDHLGGVPVLRFAPRQERRAGLVLFLHGGSFLFGSCRSTHRELAAGLALGTRVELLGVEYRLAPEHPHPAQLADALAVWDALLASGVRAGSIVIVGDSAGANLALSLALALRDRASPMPRALALLSPWCDLTMPGAAYVDNADFDYGTRAILVRQAATFAGGVALDAASVSPARAALHDLPPTLVTAGDAELLRDDISALATKLEASGVATTTFRAADMPHNASLLASLHPNAKATLDAVVAFVVAQLDASAQSGT